MTAPAVFGPLLAVLAVVASGAPAPAAFQETKGRPASAAGQAAPDELDELGETLKAAVLSGTLSEEDAIKIYRTMAERLKPASGKGKGERAKGAGLSKVDFVRLSAPRPEQIAAIFRPEFRRRDLSILLNQLDLDSNQSMIAELLIADYLEAFELASSPLREALGRYQRATTDQWLAAALERAQIEEVDVAVANTQEALERFARGAAAKETTGQAATDATERDEKRAARHAWGRRMLEVTTEMDARLTKLRDRVQSEVVELDRDGATITADDLVRMARTLRAERSALRVETTESLERIAVIEESDDAKARCDAAMARMRIEHLLRHGRLGGESMNLWAALAEMASAREPDGGDAARYEDAAAMSLAASTLR